MAEAEAKVNASRSKKMVLAPSFDSKGLIYINQVPRRPR
jgi:hypothetical protein